MELSSSNPNRLPNLKKLPPLTSRANLWGIGVSSSVWIGLPWTEVIATITAKNAAEIVIVGIDRSRSESKMDRGFQDFSKSFFLLFLQLTLRELWIFKNSKQSA